MNNLVGVSQAPIGIFDSGVGGLSILTAIQKAYPHEELVYVADQAHVPYGRRSLAEVRGLAHGLTRFLLSEGAKVIVVACNTASAAALHELRWSHPEVPFVGMEPAIKPAAEQTHSGKVGVLATPATFQGTLYRSLLDRFAQGVTVYQDTCPGLVEEIEAGRLDGAETRRILSAALNPMVSAGVDRVVLGCTHYPFVIPQIQEIAGPGLQVIDPAPAIARQTGRLLEKHGLHHPGSGSGEVHLWTSGLPEALRNLLPALMEPSGGGARGGQRWEAYEIGGLVWEKGHLQPARASARGN